MNTQNLHPLDRSIASNPAIVTFYKIVPGRLLLKKFIFICESSIYVINLLSSFPSNLKAKFYARIFLVNLA